MPEKHKNKNFIDEKKLTAILHQHVFSKVMLHYIFKNKKYHTIFSKAKKLHCIFKDKKCYTIFAKTKNTTLYFQR
jgi:catabolite regulation protein CreA